MATYKTLKRGSTGSEVKRMQKMLIARGYSCGHTGADGNYGSFTVAAVAQFQQEHKLTVDGIAGPKTLGALYTTDWAEVGRAYAECVEDVGKLDSFKRLEVLTGGG